jgi:hypothetical protein
MAYPVGLLSGAVIMVLLLAKHPFGLFCKPLTSPEAFTTAPCPRGGPAMQSFWVNCRFHKADFLVSREAQSSGQSKHLASCAKANVRKGSNLISPFRGEGGKVWNLRYLVLRPNQMIQPLRVEPKAVHGVERGSSESYV